MKTHRLECDMSAAVVAWVKAQGFRAYCEVPMPDRIVDIVGVSKAEVVTVELKLALSPRVIRQALINQLWANRSYVAISRRPRAASKKIYVCASHGVGILLVAESVTVVLEPRWPKRYVQFNYISELRAAVARLPEGGTAGLPTLAGVGPAIECARRVDRYRVDHPRATWDEIFAAVPNHYSHSKSMACALRHKLLPRRGVV